MYFRSVVKRKPVPAISKKKLYFLMFKAFLGPYALISKALILSAETLKGALSSFG